MAYYPLIILLPLFIWSTGGVPIHFRYDKICLILRFAKDVLKNHVCYMSISGEPHIDGDPGDLRFKIKQQKYVILKVFYIFSLENGYIFKGSKSAILIFAYLLDKGQLLKVVVL